MALKVKLWGFVHVDENCAWAYDSFRKWRSYDYGVIVVLLKGHSTHTFTHEYAWNVYDYDNVFVLIERLLSWTHYEHDVKGLLTY